MLQRNQNRTFLFSKNCIRTKPKCFKLRQDCLKTIQNFYLFQKKFGNRPEQKLLDQIFLVMIENVLFRSTILFLKRIHSIFFGTKAAKRMLSILKERWFDIATPIIEFGTNLSYVCIKQLQAGPSTFYRKLCLEAGYGGKILIGENLGEIVLQQQKLHDDRAPQAFIL